MSGKQERDGDTEGQKVTMRDDMRVEKELPTNNITAANKLRVLSEIFNLSLVLPFRQHDLNTLSERLVVGVLLCFRHEGVERLRGGGDWVRVTSYNVEED